MPTTNDKNEDTATPVIEVPSGASPGTQQWFQIILNQINGQLDKIDQRLGGIENRLWKVEKFTWLIGGGLLLLGVIWMFVQFLFSNFDITLTPK